MGMKQYTYCGPMVFVKPIVDNRTRVCRIHGEKEGLYCNICGKDLIYKENRFDYDDNVWNQFSTEMSKIDNPFNNILLTPTHDSHHYQLPEGGIIDPDFSTRLDKFNSDYAEELYRLRNVSIFVDVKWVIVNYWA